MNFDVENTATHTVLKIHQSDPMLYEIMHGNFHALNATYRDQDGQHFPVFQTTSGHKFIYAPMDSSQPAALVPLKLIEVFNQHSLKNEKQFVNPYAASPVRSVREDETGRPFWIANGIPFSSNAAYKNMRAGMENELQFPVKIQGMRQFLSQAVASHVQRAFANSERKDEERFVRFGGKQEERRDELCSCIDENSGRDGNQCELNASASKRCDGCPDINYDQNNNEFAVTNERCEREYLQPKVNDAPSELEEDEKYEKYHETRCKLDLDHDASMRSQITTTYSHKTVGFDVNENEATRTNTFTALGIDPESPCAQILEKETASRSCSCNVDIAIQCSPKAYNATHINPQEVLEKLPLQTAEDFRAVFGVDLDFPTILRLERSALLKETNSGPNLTASMIDESTTEGDATQVNSKYAAVYPEDTIDALKIITRDADTPLPQSFAIKSSNFVRKLFLQRIADDDLLEIIGKSMYGLKHLDVSGSSYVTNMGIRLLFIKSARENSSLCLMSSWIHKNLHIMNPILHSLEYLDFSYTSANFYSRRLVGNMPHSFVVQRTFRLNDSNASGHYIFYRGKADLSSQIDITSKLSSFNAQLQKLIGPKATSEFIKLAQILNWKHLWLTLRDVDTSKKVPARFQIPSMAYVTISEADRRIVGQMTFLNGHITRLFVCGNVELEVLLTCPKLESSCASKTGSMPKRSHTDTLVHVDTICEPSTLLSLIANCPSLKKLQVRIRNGDSALTDADLTNTINKSQCRDHLEQLWIVPAFVITLIPSAKLAARSKCPQGTKYVSYLDDERLVGGFAVKRDIEEACCKLSVDCVKEISGSCVMLNEVGNLAGWAEVTRSQFELLENELKVNGSCVTVRWEQILLTQLDLRPQDESSDG